MVPLTNTYLESYDSQENCHICRKKVENEYSDDKIYRKVRGHCTGKYRDAAHTH